MPPLKIVPIVEGDGEVSAVPLLLRRYLGEVKQRYDIQVAPSKNAHGKHNLLKEEGLERFLKYAQAERDVLGIILIIDTDELCAKELAFHLSARSQKLNLKYPVVIVCAQCEYEAWFLASLDTVKSQVGIDTETEFLTPVEELRNVKGWISSQMPAGKVYKETEDQPAMTSQMKFDLVRAKSRSFRRFEHAIDELLSLEDQETRGYVSPFSSTD